VADRAHDNGREIYILNAAATGRYNHGWAPSRPTCMKNAVDNVVEDNRLRCACGGGGASQGNVCANVLGGQFRCSATAGGGAPSATWSAVGAWRRRGLRRAA
jgi:hypothetical protein